MSHVCDFNPTAIADLFTEDLQLPYKDKIGIRGKGWQFVILLPRRVITEDRQETICTGHDEDVLCKMLADQFGGYTVDIEPVSGFGLRDGKPETNLHRRITVVAAPSSKTLRYFQALGRELEGSSGEEQIFITRQEVLII